MLILVGNAGKELDIAGQKEQLTWEDLGLDELMVLSLNTGP